MITHYETLEELLKAKETVAYLIDSAESELIDALIKELLSRTH